MTERADHTSPPERYDSLSPEELFLLYRDNDDTEAFNTLVLQFEPLLLQHLNKKLRNAGAAEDVCQETFIQLIRTKDAFDGTREFRPWLFTLASHKAVDYHRKMKRHTERRVTRKIGDPNVGECPLYDYLASYRDTDQLEVQELMASVRARVADLPDVLQAPIKLVFYEGLRRTEAAQVLRIPVGTVKNRIATALRQLSQPLT